MHSAKRLQERRRKTDKHFDELKSMREAWLKKEKEAQNADSIKRRQTRRHRDQDKMSSRTRSSHRAASSSLPRHQAPGRENKLLDEKILTLPPDALFNILSFKKGTINKQTEREKIPAPTRHISSRASRHERRRKTRERMRMRTRNLQGGTRRRNRRK